MKNFKLLLATTAILSTGALMANAEFQKPELEIKAQAEFATGITISYPRNMSFGVIDPRGEGNVVIDIDTGHLSGTALIIRSAAEYEDYRGQININGVKGFYDLWASGGEYIVIDSDDETITLYEDEETKAKKCATVSNLNYKVNAYSQTGTGQLEIYTSGTLNVDKNNIPTGGYAKCTGSATVTYVLSDD